MAKHPPIDDEEFGKGMQVAVMFAVDDFAALGSHEVNTLNGLLVTCAGQLASYDKAAAAGLLRLLADTIESDENRMDDRQARTRLDQLVAAYEQQQGFPTTTGRA